MASSPPHHQRPQEVVHSSSCIYPTLSSSTRVTGTTPTIPWHTVLNSMRTLIQEEVSRAVALATPRANPAPDTVAATSIVTGELLLPNVYITLPQLARRLLFISPPTLSLSLSLSLPLSFFLFLSLSLSLPVSLSFCPFFFLFLALFPCVLTESPVVLLQTHVLVSILQAQYT